MYELAPMVRYRDGTVDRWLWEQPSTSAIATQNSHMDMDTGQLRDEVSVIRSIARYTASRSGRGDNTNVYSKDGATQKCLDRQWRL